MLWPILFLITYTTTHHSSCKFFLHVIIVDQIELSSYQVFHKHHQNLSKHLLYLNYALNKIKTKQAQS